MDYEQEFCQCCGYRGEILAQEIISTSETEASIETSLQCPNCGHEWETQSYISPNDSRIVWADRFGYTKYCSQCGELTEKCHCITIYPKYPGSDNEFPF